LNYCFSKILEKSAIEEFFPRIKFEEQIQGRLKKVYKLWIYLNLPYFKDTFSIEKNDIANLPEVKETFKDAVNARFNTLRNSFLKWKKRRKNNKYQCQDKNVEKKKEKNRSEKEKELQ